MRKLIVSLIAGIVGTFVMASTAQAIPTFTVSPTFTFTFSSTSTSVTFDIILSFTAGDGLLGYAVSLEWDSGPTPDRDLASVTSTPPAGFSIQIPIGGPVDQVGASPGTVSSYAASSTFAAPAPGTFTIGTLTLHHSGVLLFQPTSITPLLVGGDGASDATGFICSSAGGGAGCAFNSATVDHIPEPATGALLGFGLLGIAAAGRRVRRR